MFRAYEAGGSSAVVVGLFAWEKHKLRWARDGKLPEYAKLAYQSTGGKVGMHRKTFRTALFALEEAGLLKVERSARNRAYRIRIIPVEGEEAWTKRNLRWNGG
jgi:DNA-binding transcriptional ArsR family regulator